MTEKAFDRLEWAFVNLVVSHLDLRNKFQKWVTILLYQEQNTSIAWEVAILQIFNTKGV